jgi:hypothetical protein
VTSIAASWSRSLPPREPAAEPGRSADRIDIRAAWLGDAKSVRLLLNRGADPFLKSYFGNTALDEARQKGYGSSLPETVRVLNKAMKRK